MKNKKEIAMTTEKAQKLGQELNQAGFSLNQVIVISDIIFEIFASEDEK